MFDYEIPADEPVCPNCEDAGCEYCETMDNGFIPGGNDELSEDYDDDGQPTEYDEWQDYMGGDDDPRDYDVGVEYDY